MSVECCWGRAGVVRARVVDVESLSLDAKSRKRYLYLDHLPLASSVHLCEVDLFEPGSDSGPEVEPEPESEPGTKSDGEGVRATEAEPEVEPGSPECGPAHPLFGSIPILQPCDGLDGRVEGCPFFHLLSLRGYDGARIELGVIEGQA